MKFTLLGTRGSRPILTPERIRYGGNTTSYKISVDGMNPIFVDGGTGIFREGVRAMKAGEHPYRACFLITHTHWDHILAFPFFSPLYDKDTKICIMGPRSEKYDIETLFEHQHAKGLIPIPFKQIRDQITFHELYPDQDFSIEQAAVKTLMLNHQGLTLGYRITANGKSVCIITDNAPIKNNHLSVLMKNWSKDRIREYEQEFTDKLIRFVAGADLMVHDCHFTIEGIIGKENWGHAYPEMAAELALKGEVKQLIIGHHAPEDKDTDVDQKVESARNYLRQIGYPNEVEIFAVQEGVELCL